MIEKRTMKRALVLTGGGARAAYQVGVLKAITEFGNISRNPFEIITGISAGAINGVKASASIPLFFEPVYMDGNYYCDGCVRLTSPLSPAIHLGADKILAIGIRHPRSSEKTLSMVKEKTSRQPEPADIAGLLLNALFMDLLDEDLERVTRINSTVRQTGFKGLRDIPTEVILPSQDLGNQAADLLSSFPFAMRHMLKGLGASRGTGWDLLSYLAFDKQYTSSLLEIGYKDGLDNRSRIIEFLEE